MKKVCSKCGVEKELEEFHRRRNSKDGLFYCCKVCSREQGNKWYEDNPRRYKDTRLKRKYGIGLEDYERMFEEQGGVCLLCKEPEQIKGRGLAVDHLHGTDKIRGLLCMRCNTALERVENPSFMVAVAAYITTYKITVELKVEENG